VDTSSAPYFAKTRANSTIPDLSVTLSSTRRIGFMDFNILDGMEWEQHSV
jgi:hypothetical protein